MRPAGKCTDFNWQMCCLRATAASRREAERTHTGARFWDSWPTSIVPRTALKQVCPEKKNTKIYPLRLTVELLRLMKTQLNQFNTIYFVCVYRWVFSRPHDSSVFFFFSSRVDTCAVRRVVGRCYYGCVCICMCVDLFADRSAAERQKTTSGKCVKCNLVGCAVCSLVISSLINFKFCFKLMKNCLRLYPFAVSTFVVVKKLEKNNNIKYTKNISNEWKYGNGEENIISDPFILDPLCKTQRQARVIQNIR